MQHVMIEAEPEVEAKLLAIPSATTYAERQLALHYAASLWDGTGDVFENGTLLGGATRALAMGMLMNEQRASDAQLWTFDWFSLSQPLDVSDDAFPTLVDHGFLLAAEVESARRAKTFLPLFEALHENEDYWSLVRPRVVVRDEALVS